MRLVSPGQRQVERVERLLAGELVDTAEIAYDFDGWHVGVVIAGPEAEDAIGGLFAGLDCRRLQISRGEGTIWAWLGSRRCPDPVQMADIVAKRCRDNMRVATGEPVRLQPPCRLPSSAPRASSATPMWPCWPASPRTSS